MSEAGDDHSTAAFIGADGTEGAHGGPRPADCPRCGATEVVPIVYGYPSRTTFEAAARGEVALGGCVVFAHAPTWRCLACRLEGPRWDGPVLATT